MKTGFFLIISTLLLSSMAWGQSSVYQTETNSLSRAVLKMAAKKEQPKDETQTKIPYTHKSEQNNSLARGALAKQGVNVNLRVNSASKVNYSNTVSKREQHNSFFHAVLAKQFNQTQ